MISIAVCAGLTESIVRLLGLAPEITRIQVDMEHGSFESSLNPVLRYIPKPNSPGINSYGIRDREYSIKKPEGVFRIVVIGDSVGYGFCNDKEVLDVEHLFSKQLERGLQGQKSFPIEVINLCVSGYDTLQEVEFLYQKGLALKPDLVLVAWRRDRAVRGR